MKKKKKKSLHSIRGRNQWTSRRKGHSVDDPAHLAEWADFKRVTEIVWPRLKEVWVWAIWDRSWWKYLPDAWRSYLFWLLLLLFSLRLEPTGQWKSSAPNLTKFSLQATGKPCALAPTCHSKFRVFRKRRPQSMAISCIW